MDVKNSDKIEVEKKEEDEEEEEEVAIDPQNPTDAEKKKKKKKKKKAAKKADGETAQTTTPQEAKLEAGAAEKDSKMEEDGEESGDEAEGNQAGGDGEAAKKKKKKKNKKKKNGGEAAKPVEETKEEMEVEGLPPKVGKKFIEMLCAGQEIKKERAQDNSSVFRVISDWKEGPTKQTNPPTIRVDEQFPNKQYPEGEMHPYKGNNSYRTSKAEMKEKDKLMEFELQNLRKAAECHRQVRKWVESYVRPGRSLVDIAEKLEDLNRYLVSENGLHAGIAFPTGLSLNNIAAHYSPNPGDDDIVLKYDDVLKVDFGTHVEGKIIDSAFTVAFNPQYDNLLMAVKEATNAGVREAGIDARMGDLGAVIQEVMESYEVEIGGKTYPVKSIRNLNGHDIAPYKIHGGKQVPMVKGGNNQKMEEGELYAIETFGSTGKGWVSEDGDCSHFMKNWEAPPMPLRHPKAKGLLRHINETYSTLPFCRRWLDRAGETGHILALKGLVNAGLVDACPPLVDTKGSYIAQFEHTFVLKPTCKEVLSRGDDY